MENLEMDFTPARKGYKMPAEWESHARCWMAWPTDKKLWLDHLETARAAYAQVARSILKHEPVTMLVHPDDAADARKMLDDGVVVVPRKFEDGWMRDIGPQFLYNAEKNALGGVEWGFNGWGGHFLPCAGNAAVAAEVLSLAAETKKVVRFVAPMILEGGAVHVDGEGTLLTTSECLLNGNRNPHLSRGEVEKNLRDYLGVEKIIWLPHGLVDDLTDGHVDNVAAFVAPGVVLAAAAETDDANQPRLRQNLEVLQAASDAKGRKLTVHQIALPKKQLYFQGARLPMSYINFYLPNGALILPLFDDENDDRAVGIMRNLFPERTVETTPGTAITYGGGCVHCITQQQPALLSGARP